LVCLNFLQKWGKGRHGKQRYRCPNCEETRTKELRKAESESHRNLYYQWLMGKKTQAEIAEECRVDERTIRRWFAPFTSDEPQPKKISCRDKVIISDGYYVSFGAEVLIVQLTDNRPVAWHFTYRENFLTWLETFEKIEDTPFAMTSDGQKGMIKAAHTRWPKIIIQRCQFHVIHYVCLLLTKHPETRAAIDFKTLTKQIVKVKTKADLGAWLYNFKHWYQQYGEFLKERTYQELRTPTGRKRWHYTHGHLHTAFSHVKNAFPNLFQYLKYPEIPNTSNRIEGLNSLIRNQLLYHRGTNLSGQRQLIATFLRHRQR
jgi:hypothetical protein